MERHRYCNWRVLGPRRDRGEGTTGGTVNCAGHGRAAASPSSGVEGPVLAGVAVGRPSPGFAVWVLIGTTEPTSTRDADVGRPTKPGTRHEVAMTMQPKNVICLWFDKDAEEAARFYAATFPDSEVRAVSRAPGDFRGASLAVPNLSRTRKAGVVESRRGPGTAPAVASRCPRRN